MGDQRGVDISPEDRLASKILLGESTLKKIDYYLTKSYLSDLDVYNVFKEFFSGYLELNYEFTCKDLLEETKKTFMDTSTKAKLDSLVNKLRIIEYSDESFDQKDLIEILKSLKNIVDTLLEITKNQNKRSFFSKLFGSKTKQNEFVPKEIVVEESLDELNKDEKIEEKENILDEPIINEEEPEKEEYDEPIEIIGDEVKEDFEVHEDWTGEPKKIKKTKNIKNINKKKVEKNNKINIKEQKKINIKDKKIKKIKNKTPEKKENKKKRNNEKSKEIKNDISSKSMSSLISEAKKIRSKNKLEEIYKTVLTKYNSLSEQSQNKYYAKVNKLYERLKK